MVTSVTSRAAALAWRSPGPTGSDAVLAQYAAAGLSRSVAITDSLDNLQRNWAGLSTLAAAGKIASVQVTNAAAGPLTLSASALLSGKSLLSKLGSTQVVVADTGANIVANLGSLQLNASRFKAIQIQDPQEAMQLSQAQWQAAAPVFAKMQGGQYQLSLTGVTGSSLARVVAQSQVTSFSFADTSANVMVNWNTLSAAAQRVRSVNLQGTAATLSLSDAQYQAGQQLRSAIQSPYTVTLSQVAAAQVATRLGDAHVVSVKVQDKVANVSAQLDALQQATGKLQEIKLTDTTNPMQVSVQQLLGAPQGFWGKVGGKLGFQVVDSGANLMAGLDQLQQQASRITSLTVSDTTRPTLSVTAAQYKNDGAVLAKLKGAALSVKFAGNYEDYAIKTRTDGSISVTDSQKRTYETNTFKGVNFFEFKDFTAFGDTGDANLNALLSGASNFWWFQPGAQAKASADALKPGVYGLDNSSARHDITYSFMDRLPATASDQDRNGFQTLNTAQREAVQSAFDYLSSLINVRFVLDENAKAGTADINFGTNSQVGSAGYANPPNGSGDHNVFLMLDRSSVSGQALQPGNYGWHTLIHEIGHTLGLKHPGNYNATASAMTGPFLPKALDNDRYSVMSYYSPSDSGDVALKITPNPGQLSTYEATAQTLYASTYMTYDIAALQFIYGAADTESASAPTVSFDSDWRGFQTLYTPEGGTLDLSQVDRANVLDLRAGAYSSVNILGNSVSGYLSSLPTVPKLTSSYLKTNQTYLGFNNVGLAYGSEIDRVLGGQAADTIYVGADCPSDGMSIDGGSGVDTVCLAGTASDWSLDGATEGAQVATQARNLQTGALLQLSGIEKLRFYNASTTALTHSSLDLMA